MKISIGACLGVFKASYLFFEITDGSEKTSTGSALMADLFIIDEMFDFRVTLEPATLLVFGRVLASVARVLSPRTLSNRDEAF